MTYRHLQVFNEHGKEQVNMLEKSGKKIFLRLNDFEEKFGLLYRAGARRAAN
jgi:hypothetical protein